MAEAIDVLKRQGAVIVDPADIPSVVDPDPAAQLSALGHLHAVSTKPRTKKCSIDFAYGMERDFNAWLAALGRRGPVETLTELRKWNIAHQKAGAIKYGQSLLDFSDAMDLEVYRARYEADRAKDLRLTATHGIDEVMQIAQARRAAVPRRRAARDIAARPGYPTVMVPFGDVPNAPTPPFPEGFDAKPAPFGVSFTGTACSEPKLLALAYAFEQATQRRVPPPAMP